MSALDLLKQQHDEVNELFNKVGSQDTELEQQIITKLNKHSEIEENIFYPALEKKHQTAPYVPHAEAEHAELKQLLSRWEGTRGQTWILTAEEIMDSVRHHVKEEESEIFPAVKEAFTEEELENLGNEMASY